MRTTLLEQIQNWVRDHREELVEDLTELVKIRSVSEPDETYAMGAGCARCADKAMEIGDKHGFRTENHDYYCVSLVLEGAGTGELGILGHMDVVPEGSGWSYPPYGAELHDGYMIGRGAGDNKGACVMSMYAMRCIRDLGLPMFHDVRLILGFNEESGMRDVEHYLKVKKPPLFTIVCDGAWPMIIGEKGILTANLTTTITDDRILAFSGGITSNSVPDSAWVRLRTDRRISELGRREDIQVQQIPEGLEIRAAGVACHAMAPEGGKNAILVLTEYLLEENLLDGDSLRAVRFVHRVVSDYYGGGLGIENEDTISGKTTCIGGMICFEGGELTLNINVRYAIRTARQAQKERLLAACAGAGFRVEDFTDSGPRYMSAEEAPAAQLLKLYRRLTGDEAVPIIMGGGTHARKFPNALPYGPGHWGFQGKFGGAHSVDEGVYLEHLTEAIPIYVAALLQLDCHYHPRDSMKLTEDYYV